MARNTTSFIIADALCQRDECNFRTLDEAFKKLSECGGTLDIGNGWKLSFDLEFIGFSFRNDKFIEQLPNGIQKCPVRHCDGSFNGGWYCQHYPYINKLPESALFRNHVYDKEDFIRLKNELSTRFGGIPFQATKKEDSVMKRLKSMKRPIVMKELNVVVECTTEGHGVSITLLDTMAQFIVCSEVGCTQIAVHEAPYWKCNQHTVIRERLHPKQTSKYKDKGLETLKKFIQNRSKSKSKTENMINFIKYLRKRGSAGRCVHFVNKCKIRFRLSQNYILSYSAENGSFLEICIACGDRITTAKKTTFCEKCNEKKWKIDKNQISRDVDYGGTLYNESE